MRLRSLCRWLEAGSTVGAGPGAEAGVISGDQLLALFKQRDVTFVAMVVEGLQFMIQDARSGDAGAKGTLQALAKALREIDDFESPLTVVRNQ
jgi:hypothetical protein